MQTMNPFNKNKRGFPKTREEIMDELVVRKKEWDSQPLICRSCEESGKK